MVKVFAFSYRLFSKRYKAFDYDVVTVRATTEFSAFKKAVRGFKRQSIDAVLCDTLAYNDNSLLDRTNAVCRVKPRTVKRGSS